MSYKFCFNRVLPYKDTYINFPDKKERQKEKISNFAKILWKQCEIVVK